MLLAYSPDKRHYAYDGPKISCTETYARCYKRLNNYYSMMDMVTGRIAKSMTVAYGVLTLISIHIVQNTSDTAAEARAAW